MKVLITNDDGVYAEGIKLLVEKTLKYTKDIYVVAPKTEKSANSHALNIKKGLKLEKIEDIVPGVLTYALDGTPADCVIFALKELKLDFDVVFSGVNKGYNLGDDIIYSGTFAAAQEAMMKGKKGVAFSCKYDSFLGLSYFDEVMEYLLNSPLWQENVILNINFPKTSKGIRITHQAKSTYESYFVKQDDLYYSHCNTDLPLNDEPNGDIQTIKNGYVSISPLGINYTVKDIYHKYKN